MAVNFKNFSSGVNFGFLASDPPGDDGDVYYNTTMQAFRGYQNGSWQNLISGGGSSDPITLAQISTPSAPASGFDSLYFKNDDNLYILNAAGIERPILQSGSAAFATYASTIVNTDDTGVTNTSFETISNSPAFTITPTITGTYKVYASIPLYSPFQSTSATARIFNTSANASLLQESQAVLEAVTTGTAFNALCNVTIQSTYVLIAGNTYVFDIQTESSSGNSVQVLGGNAPYYMFCEGIGLNGTLNTGGSSFALFTSNPVTTESGEVTSVYPTFTTFDNSPAFTFTPAVSGTYKIYTSAPIEQTTTDNLATAQIICTSGGATQLSQSLGSTYINATGGGAFIQSVFVQSTYLLTAGTAYVFDIQGSVDSGGGAYLRGDGTSFCMYAEGIGLANNAASQFPVKMKASGSFSGSGTIILGTVYYDSNSAYNPSTGEFIVPYAGDYVVGMSAQSTSGGIITFPAVNGNLPNGAPTFFFDTSGQNGDIAATEIHIANLNVGDVVTWESDSSTVYNTNTSFWIYSVNLATALQGPQGRTTGNAFAYYASNVVNTQSAAVDGGYPGTWTTFSTSPAFTFTPTISGIYKVYSNPSLYNVTSSTEGAVRVFNTSGGATLLQESQGEIYESSGAPLATVFCQSVYSLTAGVTYVFDLQGQTNGAANLYLHGGIASFYMFAEGIGLSGNFQAPVTPWQTNLAFTPNSSFGSYSGLSTQTRVIGDTLEVKVYLTAGSSLPSTPMALALPTGYAIDATKLSSAGAVLEGWANSQFSGAAIDINTAEYLTYPFFDGSDVNNIYFASQTASNALVKAVSNSYLQTSAPWQATFRVPIVGLYGGQLDAVSTIIKSNTTGTDFPIPYNGIFNLVLDTLSQPLKATVTTNGGDVEIGLQDDGSGNPGSVYADDRNDDSSTVTLQFLRDGVPISTQVMYTQNNIAINELQLPASAFRFIDSPPAGTHTYTVQVKTSGTSSANSAVTSAVLFAKPLSALGGTFSALNNNGSSSGTYAQAYFSDTTYQVQVSGTAFADFTLNAGSNALTIRQNNGLTLTPAAGNLPGITFTPSSSSAVYLVIANYSVYGVGTEDNSSYQLTDGTQVIAWNSGFQQQAGGDGVFVPAILQGIYIPGNTNPVTVKIQGQSYNGGTAYMEGIGALSTAVEWTVIQLSNGGPSPWIPYTPTFTNMGAVTGATFWYKYDGTDSIYIKGTFTPPSPSAALAEVSLPPGFTMQASKINGTVELAGSMAENDPNAVTFYVLIQPADPTNLNFGYQTWSAGGLTPLNASDVFSPGQTYSIYTTAIPIA